MEERSRLNIPSFDIGRAAVAPLSPEKALRRKLKNRPEWGEGHAGGVRMRDHVAPRRRHQERQHESYHTR